MFKGLLKNKINKDHSNETTGPTKPADRPLGPFVAKAAHRRRRCLGSVSRPAAQHTGLCRAKACLVLGDTHGS